MFFVFLRGTYVFRMDGATRITLKSLSEGGWATFLGEGGGLSFIYLYN